MTERSFDQRFLKSRDLVDANDSTYAESGPLSSGGVDNLRLGLADSTQPASFSNLALILKWVARNNGIMVDLRLYSSGVLVAKAARTP